MIRSLIGSTRNSFIALNTHLFPMTFTNPLFLSLSTNLFIGAVNQRLPVDDRCNLLFLITFLVGPQLFVTLLMKVPKNKAFPLRVFVIRVFSMDSSNLSVFIKLVIRFFNSLQYFFVPQIPISQSSAYRTYSIRVKIGFGHVLLCFLRSLIILALSFQKTGRLGLCLSAPDALIFRIRAVSEA